jgi:hypothetical protein
MPRIFASWRKNLKLFFPIIFIGAFFALAKTSQAATYYVDKDSKGGTCNDTNAGASIIAPWCSIAKANSTLKAGDTAYLREGTYVQQIKPANSGSSLSMPIIYTRYGNETVILNAPVEPGAIELSSKSYIVIDGLRVRSGVKPWVNMKPAHYCVIKNCYFYECWAYNGLQIDNGATYNKIINNIFVGFRGPNGTDLDSGPGDTIHCWHSSYNIIQDNKFGYSLHSSVSVQGRTDETTGNVVRRNVISNPWHGGLGFGGPEAYNNLWEENTVSNCGSESASNPDPESADWSYEENAGFQPSGERAIIRRNIFIDNGNSMKYASYIGSLTNPSSFRYVMNNRIYNNTSYSDEYGFNAYQSDYPNTDNVFKNNAVIDSGIKLLVNNISSSQGTNYFSFNNFFRTNMSSALQYKKITYNSVSALQAAFPLEVSNNLQIAPGFKDPANGDFFLLASSPMINAGGWLTKVTGVNGNNISVQDARYFFSGISNLSFSGDTIKDDDGVEAVITAINYDTNVLTVNNAFGITADDYLSLPYYGSKPDIGAKEYIGGDTQALASPSGLSVR